MNAALDKMILSASGWRSVFAADGDEESASGEVPKAYSIIAGAAAYVFAEYLARGVQKKTENKDNILNKPVALLGTDTRPTGKAIIEAMMSVLLAYGCEVRYAGIVAAPEIMAWARKEGAKEKDRYKHVGFIYISASHNPIGHNGVKFGLTDGGVLPAEEAIYLIEEFKTFINNDENIQKIENIIFTANHTNGRQDVEDGVRAGSWLNSSHKPSAYNAYFNFAEEVVWDGSDLLAAAVRENLAKKPLGVVCDFNGSARTVSIDTDFFSKLGILTGAINHEPGQIVHRIVPEGDSLNPCCLLLEAAYKSNDAYVLGYVPDCDGDRGNLIIWDDAVSKARPLESQEVFALAVAAELSHLVWTGGLKFDETGKALTKAAVAVNDPTSMRIDRIAGAFGVSVFRAEVGEANVVSLARKLREEGYIARILGEGSAGGNITHPCAVRDPVNTVLALVKMLCVRSTNTKPGLFEIWCKYSCQMDKYCADFTLADIIASLPEFTTTPVYHVNAVMRIKTPDHSVLKNRYQDIFLREWEKKRDELKNNYNIFKWEAAAYNGIVEKRNISRFGDAGRGGLKIIFFDDKKREIAYIWMRGSATEPVFRIMADAEGCDQAFERRLLDWQKQMIMEADSII
ncbi:MAG: phosphatidylglycerol lysyltransferase [Treponema sp.]|nr:phosphatidylglycerol lysyltransferase [Treponema sp.]